MHKGNALHVSHYSKLMHWYRWQEFKLPFFNELARLTLGIKNYVDQINVNKQVQISNKKLDEFLRSQQMFFVLSTFRSGSTFLADLLSKEIHNSCIYHEPNINDYWNYPKVLSSVSHADNYVNAYRKKDIYQRIYKRDVDVYGEFNPFLVLHCQAIKESIPSALLFHLVRDGRHVVRSNYSREVLGKKDPMLKLISPPKDDLYYQQWNSFNRFEKICWKWQYENKLLRETIGNTIQFEQLLSDFDYFDEKINKAIGINITKEKWSNYINRPKHASPKYRLPHWINWSLNNKKSFEIICAEEMHECGYKFELS